RGRDRRRRAAVSRLRRVRGAVGERGDAARVLEAMALGVPVLASDIAAHRELLGGASPGLVAGTPEAFAVGLGGLLADQEARATLAAEQRTRARSEFDARQMLTTVEAIYGEGLRL